MSLHALQQLLQVFGGNALVQSFNPITEGLHEGVQILHFFRIRLLMHPIYGRDPHAVQPASHRLIGYQHKFLDHPVGNAALMDDDIYRMPVLIQHDLRLWNIKL